MFELISGKDSISTFHRSLTSSSARSHVGAVKVSKPHQVGLKKNQKQVSISPASTVLELRSKCKEAGLLQRGSKDQLLVRLGWRKEDPK